MKQEDKELLLKDLCGRLPYEVKCNISRKNENCVKSRTIDSILDCHWLSECKSDFYEIKPYLYPLSSMTEEHKNELKKIIYVETEIICNQLKTNNYGIEDGKYHFNSILQVDWLNKNHFDYRGLIEKSLALDATGLSIYKEETK